MWKKLLIAFIALMGTFTVGYAYFNMNMDAASKTYQAGGQVSGKVNLNPNGVSSSLWSKGDKFILGIKDSSNNNMTWMLVYNSVNKTWMCVAVNAIGTTNMGRIF